MSILIFNKQMYATESAEKEEYVQQAGWTDDILAIFAEKDGKMHQGDI